MLQQLFIKNYAIIDLLKINFTKHLNIITGETGAGKSILMGALSLILGDRADTSVLLDKENKCIVEGHFETGNKSVKNFFSENGLDEESEIIIRREISPSGKSRAFINDTPVTLAQLKVLASLLVDLHRQFDTLDLNKNDFQLEVLDAMAANETLLREYKKVFFDYRLAKTQLEKLTEDQEAANKEFDYNQFLFNELEQADFSENEVEETESELKLMSNAENIKSILTNVAETLNDGEEPLLQNLKSLVSKIESIHDLVPGMKEIEQRIKSAHIELDDIANEIESINSSISFSEERLADLNSRMDLGYTLMKKHHVQTTSELLMIKDQLDAKMQKATDLGLEIEKKQQLLSELYAKLKDLSLKISSKRKEEIPGFSKKINKLLAIVGMPNASFKIALTALDEPTEDGMDAVEFLFNANKTDYQPVRKVASGGELSRLMLIIKSLVARSMSLPTLIFDEIDTGISGEAARQVGNIIKDLSSEHQVLLITHQPQIAAKAFTHFLVYKEKKADKIITGVRLLSQDERIHAIATMLSGEKPTAAAFENAREMMN